MGMFTAISSTAFQEIQTDAGMLLNTFDPTNPASPADEDIICATTGGITVTCVPTYSDYGEDVDNVPNNTMELKHLDGWECGISTTGLGTSKESIKLAIGAADVDGNKIVPRRDLKLTDFEDAIWWVGDRSDGGMVAVKLMHVLSSGGFSLKTTKNGKGQLTIDLMGHVSLQAQNVVPMEFYSAEGLQIIDLTVVSAAGTSSGKTALTVSGHSLDTGESYVYKTGTAAINVAYGDDLSSGWTAWNGSTEITATSGQKITVAVIDSNDKAVAAGSATIVSAT